MADLTEETIAQLTRLSRIECSHEEREDLLKDLKGILSYIELLNEVDTENVTPCNQVLENMFNVTREDKVGETLPRELFLANAPSSVGGMIKVPTVIKRQPS